MASASVATAIVIVTSSRYVTIVVTVFVYVACCYHVCVFRVIVTVSTAFLSGTGMELVICVDVALR
jgi:hypothetical protein